MTERHYRHLAAERFSVGMTVDNWGAVVVAVAACAPQDQFSRAQSRELVNWRLNASFIHPNLIKGLEDFRFFTTYHGTTSRQDILYPIVDILRKEGRRPRRSVTRALNKIERFLTKYEESNNVEFDSDGVPVSAGEYQLIDDWDDEEDPYYDPDYELSCEDETQTEESVDEFTAGLLDESPSGGYAAPV